MGNTAELVREIITVSQAGKWGPKVGNEYLGLNDPLTPEDFKTGATYEVLTKRGKPTEKFPAGKKYISQIIGGGTSNAGSNLNGGVPAFVAPVVVAKTEPNLLPVEKIVDEKAAYWDKKDRAQCIGGIMHDTATIVASLVVTLGLGEQAAIDSFDRVLDKLLATRARVN